MRLKLILGVLALSALVMPICGQETAEELLYEFVTLTLQGKDDEALQAFDKAFGLDPEGASAWLMDFMMNTVNFLEVRSTVEEVIDGATYQWNVSNFAGFYYDIDDNIGTETMTLSITNTNVLDEPNGIKYETVAQATDFEFEEWGKYFTIGFLADEYFAAYDEAGYLAEKSTDDNLMVDQQLSKVLMDDDSSRTFTSGFPLKLAENYELAIQAIDLDGIKVYVQLMKDGQTVNSAVVEPSKDGATLADKTYTYKKNLGDTEELVIVAVHFKNAFRGADQDLATVDGIWQVSDTCTDVEEGTEYDKMTIQAVNTACMKITMNNEGEKISLTKNRDIHLIENIRIRTADQEVITAEVPLRFYIYKGIYDPGFYEIRSPVGEVKNGQLLLNPQNFAGLYYDIDDRIGNETLTLTITDDNTLSDISDPIGVVYRTEGELADFDLDQEWGQFYAIGFLTEEYFASYVPGTYFYKDSIDSNLMVNGYLSKVLINDNQEVTFPSLTPLKLAEGYELVIQSLDVGRNWIDVKLMKNGEIVDSAVVKLSPASGHTYTYKKDLGNTKDIVIIAVNFKKAVISSKYTFEGNDLIWTTVDGIWQISDTITDVEEDTEYDKMTIQSVDAGAKTIVMDNEFNKIALTKNRDMLLMDNIRIKTADQDEITTENPLRFYIYKEETIDIDFWNLWSVLHVLDPQGKVIKKQINDVWW
jgi:S-layer protein (TIGR01567 family)